MQQAATLKNSFSEVARNNSSQLAAIYKPKQPSLS